MEYINDLDVITTHNHVEMIKRQHLWPLDYVLPVKRWRKGELDTGLIFDGKITTVVQANLFMVEYSTGPDLTYNSVEELVADGWVVD